MGYYISTPSSAFRIRTENLPRFFELAEQMLTPKVLEENASGGSYSEGKQTKWWYSWVDSDRALKAIKSNDIREVFAEWRYDLELVNEENGESIYYLDIEGGESKIGDEEKFFAAIAPIVEDGSFLDVRGEDGEEWRWMWENGKFFVQNVSYKEVFYADPIEITFGKENSNA